MDWIVLDGVRPYDGRYEFDLDGLTTREWGWIKRLTGYLPLTLGEGWKGGDPELFACFAAIALHRAGKVDTSEVPGLFERITDGPWAATVRFEAGEQEEAEEGDAGPPAPSSTENNSTSGPGSRTSSASSDAPPNGAGNPHSDTLVSLPARSAI